MRKIIFDTSFLISLAEYYSVDEFINRYMEYEFLIPRSVVNELNKLARCSFKKSSSSRLLLKIIKNYSKYFKIIESTSDKVDEDVIHLAKRYNAIVATTDRSVRRKASEYGIKVLYFRDKYPIID